MATTSWPIALPQSPQTEKTAGGPQSNRVFWQPEIGDPMTRRRGSAAGHTYPFSFFPITHDQLQIFQEWFEEELYDGVLPFDMADPWTKEIHEWTFAKDGQPYEVTYGDGDLAALTFELYRKD